MLLLLRSAELTGLLLMTGTADMELFLIVLRKTNNERLFKVCMVL